MHASSRNHRFIQQLVDGAVARPFLNALVAQKRARVEREALFAAAPEQLRHPSQHAVVAAQSVAA